MVYTQNCEIWHGASLGTLILIQEEPIWRTMWGPSFGHKRAMFLPFLGKGGTGYTQQCEIWHGTSLSKLIRIQEEQIWRAMWGPCFGYESHTLTIALSTLISMQEELIWRTIWGSFVGHKRVIFLLFLALLIHWVIRWKTGHSFRPLVLFK